MGFSKIHELNTNSNFIIKELLDNNNTFELEEWKTMFNTLRITMNQSNSYDNQISLYLTFLKYIDTKERIIVIKLKKRENSILSMVGIVTLINKQ